MSLPIRVHPAPSVVSLPRLLEEFGDDGGPAGLVGGAEALAGVAVEVLVEEDQVAPVRVGLELLAGAEDGAAAIGAAQEDVAEPPRELGGDLPEGVRLARAGRELDRECLAQEEVELLQRLDEEEVDREPDRS